MSLVADPLLLTECLREDGFVFVAGAGMRTAIAAHGALDDWPEFAASWNDLETDGYLVDQGRFRRRRHAVFDGRDGAIARAAHQPHYQSRTFNSVYGGIERCFAPVSDAVASSRSLSSILRMCRQLFGSAAAEVARWHIEVHQFRIEARADEPGLPTPEGVHRDGVDFVLVLLIARTNIASGTTTIHAGGDPAPLGSFTLRNAFDAALLDDHRVFHGVTPVHPIDASRPAYRDVLVVTFKRNAA